MWKSNSNVSNSDFGGFFLYDGIINSKTPLRVLAPINEVKEVLIHISIFHRYQNYAKQSK